jgi:hypothetical protein
MQHYTLAFAKTVSARVKATDCSIAKALDIELQAIRDRRALLKLRDAGLDLVRIVELELQRRDDVVDAQTWTAVQ